jgi:peptidoglycan/xylan/chitin deacetylase (PgdA/CDA1 family)
MLKEQIKFAAALAYKPFVGSGRKVVLCYHSLRSEAVVNFSEQMTYLANHCETVKPSEIISAKPQGRTVVAVTFDDAFVSFDENAAAVLKELNVPAGVFVPAGYIGKPCGWQMPDGHPDTHERVVACDRLREWELNGIEVFSHTMSHPDLTAIPAERLKKELVDSKSVLEQILGHSVDVISYPHGRYDESVIAAAKESGYRLGFSIEPRCADALTNPYAIGRFVVSPSESLAKFKLKACGAYAAETVLRNLKQRMK